MIKITDNLTAWIKSRRNVVKQRMLSSAKTSSNIIGVKTTPKVPIDTGHLRRSFFSNIFDKKDLIVVEVGYSVTDNPASPGEDYSFHQHEVWYPHPQGGEQYYLRNTMVQEEESIIRMYEKDFISSLNSS